MDNELQYDAAGNLTGDANRSIGLSSVLYNILNLPRQVTVGSNQVLNVYDAKGSKRRTTSPGGVATTYEGGFEYNANGTLLRIGLEAGQLVRSSTGSYTVHYYYPDHLGNVRMVATETGGVVQQTEYYGFGLGVYRQGDISVNKYGYLNREKQPETGWLDLLARMYDPTTGRFMAVDPMTQGQEHLSPYHYGYDNPLRFSDPDGLMAEGCCGGIGDFVTGVVTAMVDNGVGVNYRSQNGVGRSAGAYNAGQNIGDGLSMVQGALEIVVGAAGNTVAGVGELLSGGLATPVAVPLAVASTGLMAHGAMTAGRGAGSLLSQNGRLNASSTKPETHQTYTKTNPQTGEVYSGRTRGTGAPASNVAKRDAGHHMSNKGFGPATLDKSTTNKAAARGREQQLIDKHGGAQSQGGTSGNAINGISEKNPKRTDYLNAAKKEFGTL